MPIVLKSASLKLLEPLGLVQACNGIALSLPLPFAYIMNIYVYVMLHRGGYDWSRNELKVYHI